MQPPKLNVLSLQESKALSVDDACHPPGPVQACSAPPCTALVDTFEHAKTFGSLIQIPYALKTHLAVLPEVLASWCKQSGDMYASAAADDLLPLVQQAQVLAMQFDAVLANPPYMGGKGMNPALKDYAKVTFPSTVNQTCLLHVHGARLWHGANRLAFNSMVTMQSLDVYCRRLKNCEKKVIEWEQVFTHKFMQVGCT